MINTQHSMFKELGMYTPIKLIKDAITRANCFNQWFKSSNKNKVKQKSNAVLMLCVISMTHLIRILIGLHLY